VEPDPPDDPSVLLDALFVTFLEQLSIPDDVLRRAEDIHKKIREAILGSIAGSASVRVYPDTAEATATAHPPTVHTVEGRVRGTIGLRGWVSGTAWDPTWSRPRTRDDLLIGAILFLYVSLAYISVTTQPFPKSLIEPLGGAIGLIAWLYSELHKGQ
jgi:hypothetical protein